MSKKDGPVVSIAEVLDFPLNDEPRLEVEEKNGDLPMKHRIQICMGFTTCDLISDGVLFFSVNYN